jgi:hypothetical protein
MMIDELQQQTKKLNWKGECPRIWASSPNAQTCVVGVDLYRPQENLDDLGAVLSVAMINANDGFSQVRMFGGVTLIRDNVSVPLHAINIGEHKQSLIDNFGERIRWALVAIDTETAKWPSAIHNMEKQMLSYDAINRIIIQQASKRWIGLNQLKDIHQGHEGPLSTWELAKRYSLAVQNKRPVIQIKGTHELIKKLGKHQ